MTSVLITGGTGYVGRKVVAALMEHECVKMVLLVRDIEKAKQLFENTSIKFIDLQNDNWKIEVGRFNPQIVLHLASYLTSSDNAKEINNLIDSNVLFGTHLLDALKMCQTEIVVNTGSFSEYNQENLLEPAYLYAASKTAFRSVLKYYQKLLGFKVIHTIPYTIYGGEEEGKKVIDYLFESRTKPINMTLGEQVLDFVHIDDIVSFFVKIINNTSELIENEYTFYLGTGRGVTIKDVAKIIEKQYKTTLNINWGGIDYRQTDVMYAVAPIEKNLTLFWKSQIPLEEGLLKYDSMNAR